MFVRPAEGRAVRDPLSRALLADDGEDKPDTRFWRRRIRDKDVETEPKAAPLEAAAEPAEGGSDAIAEQPSTDAPAVAAVEEQ